jgi:hypothetical protein
MQNQLPVTIDFGALPNTGQGYTPQQLADRLGINGRVFTEQSFALFVTGSTAPTSNVGPWAKNGNTWYYWDDVSGSYVPFILPPATLGYFIGEAEPDHTVYNFWIQTDVAGSPLALKTYYSGAWVDVYATTLAGYLTTANAAATYLTIADAATTYQTVAGMASYSTTAAMNAAIAASLATAEGYTDSAVAGIVAGKDNFRAYPSIDQSIVHGGGGSLDTDVTFGSESFDPDGVFGGSVFTAPADGYYQFTACLQIDLDTGSPTLIGTRFDIVASSGQVSSSSGGELEGTEGRFVHGGDQFHLTAGDTVKVTAHTQVDAAATLTIVAAGCYFSGFRVR